MTLVNNLARNPMMLHPGKDQKSQFRHPEGFPRDGVAISNEKIQWVLPD